MFDLFKKYVPVVQDEKFYKPINRYNSYFRFSQNYGKYTTEINARQIYHFMPKDIRDRIDIIKRPFGPEYKKYAKYEKQITKDQEESLRKFMKTGEKPEEINLPSDFAATKRAIEKDTKERLEASNNCMVFQFNLRSSFFKNRYGEYQYSRAIETVPEFFPNLSSKDYERMFHRNCEVISWTRLFLREVPRYYLTVIYCAVSNLINRKKIKEEYQQAKKESEAWIKMLSETTEENK